MKSFNTLTSELNQSRKISADKALLPEAMGEHPADAKTMIYFFNKMKDSNDPNGAAMLLANFLQNKKAIKCLKLAKQIHELEKTMPEEINRLVTDAITNYFFTTSEVANQNLLNSGVAKDKIFFVGNTMIDTLLKNLHKLSPPSIWNIQNLSMKKKVS